MLEKCWCLMPFRRRRRRRSWRWPPSWPRTTPAPKKVPLVLRLPLKNWLCPKCPKQTHSQKPLRQETKGLVQVINTIFVIPICHLNKGNKYCFQACANPYTNSRLQLSSVKTDMRYPRRASLLKFLEKRKER